METMLSFLARHTSVFDSESSVRSCESLFKRYSQQALEEASKKPQIVQADSTTKEAGADEAEELVTPGAQSTMMPSGKKVDISKIIGENKVNTIDSETKTNDKQGKDEDDDDDDPSLQVPNRQNGGSGECYTWTQSLSEIQILIPLTSDVTSKHCTIDYEDGEHLVVKIKDKTLLDGKLYKTINVNDSLPWTIDADSKGNRTLTAVLVKKDKMEWWPCVCEGEPKINTRKIEPENGKVDDLDGETREMVKKMMYDQRAKALGKPTIDELQKMEALEKFKKMNPQLDFSNAKVSF